MRCIVALLCSFFVLVGCTNCGGSQSGKLGKVIAVSEAELACVRSVIPEGEALIDAPAGSTTTANKVALAVTLAIALAVCSWHAKDAQPASSGSGSGSGKVEAAP